MFVDFCVLLSDGRELDVSGELTSGGRPAVRCPEDRYNPADPPEWRMDTCIVSMPDDEDPVDLGLSEADLQAVYEAAVECSLSRWA